MVEDDRIVRAHVEVVLINLGYEVFAVANATQAVDRAAWRKVDLRLTDRALPCSTSGHDIALSLRRSVLGLKVLFASSYLSRPIAALGSGLGSDSAFLPKPFRRDGGTTAVRALLEGASDAGAGRARSSRSHGRCRLDSVPVTTALTA